MATLYTDWNPYTCQWTENLIRLGAIGNGDVSCADIRKVDGSDVASYERVHFFSGIAGWEVALKLAGWPKEVPVWTGSCPCQPFSSAGKRKGVGDERHLWPAWRKLIDDCKPPVLFGEQVTSPDGRMWLTAVRNDLESLGYAVGCADLPAASVGAPHKRQRLWFVAVRQANGVSERRTWIDAFVQQRKLIEASLEAHGGCKTDSSSVQGVGNSDNERRKRPHHLSECAYRESIGQTSVVDARSVGDASEQRSGRDSQSFSRSKAEGQREGIAARNQLDVPVASSGSFWSDGTWLPCLDGKWRPAQPGSLPLAHGIRARVGRIGAYGNAIVPQVAAKFIQATMMTLSELAQC